MDTRTLILDRARAICLTDGFAALSMRRLAADVGVTATALYRHFAHKEAILTAIVEQGYRQFQGYLLRGLEGREPNERLFLTGEGYRTFGIEQPQAYEMIFMNNWQDTAVGLDDRVMELTRSTFRILVDRVADIQRTNRQLKAHLAVTPPTLPAQPQPQPGAPGSLPQFADDLKPHDAVTLTGDHTAEAMAYAIWALSHGLVALYIRGHMPGGAEALESHWHLAFRQFLHASPSCF